MQENFLPVLLGGDLNCYSMARAFYEACGIPSLVLGKERLGIVRHSRYLAFREVPDLGEKATFCGALRSLAKETAGKRRLLLACTDEYVRLVIENQKTLLPDYILPYPDENALPLLKKDEFYRQCAHYGIPYPETLALAELPTFEEIAAIGRDLTYPHIIKPSVSDAYWRYPFAGMQKAYLAHNMHEAESIFASIFRSGYPFPVLAQRYIGGKGSAAKTLTLYFDCHGRLALRAAARILLEEQTPRGKGNYAAAVTCPIPRVAEPLARMLTAIGYRGFANFDLRCDADGREYVLEINLRQGRSNYHLTAAGCNPAALLYRDLILKETLSPQDTKEEVLYHTAPLSLLRHYTESEEDARLLRRLGAAGKAVSPFFAPTDLFYSPLRLGYVAAHMYRQRGKFRRYAVRYR